MAKICVFCASSSRISESYFQVTREMGATIAEQGHTLVWGGGRVGLMGALAIAVQEKGGRVIGVIPEKLRTREVAYTRSDELIVTDTMAERKTRMIDESDAFVTLAGGYGTLDEMLEVLTLRQLGYHDKPIYLVNTDGFYDSLLSFLNQLEHTGFVRETPAPLYEVVDHPRELIGRIL